MSLSYVLITPAHNEAGFIEKTLQSVVSQTVLPARWVIVDDGSTDGTAQIVSRYAESHPWIRIHHLAKDAERSFGGKAVAFNTGWRLVQDLEYELIGNLDGDISFGPDFFEFLLERFEEDPELGVGGTVFEEEGYCSATDSFEGQNHVAGGCQLFRRQCLQDVGGYVVHKRGGIDWIAVTTARMLGWKTRSFREKSFFHYRRMGTADRGRFAAAFSYGEKDYYLGGHPLWQVIRCTYRAFKRPYLVEGLALGAGYVWAALRGLERPISPELVRFHRKEQMAKLRAIFKRLATFRRVDNFALAEDQKPRQ
jgi:glycosyltransferase involved in cell wall biosynthesis